MLQCSGGRSCLRDREFLGHWQRSMKAAIYARVSTSQGQSVEMQLRDLEELAARRGFAIIAKYCDEGVSGAKDSRPALDRMLADAQAGKFSVVLVWKLDRLGRSLVHLMRLMENFRGLGIELVSFSEGLDFTTTTGKLLFQIISAFAEFERDCIRERVMAGMRNAKAKGKRIGRPPLAILSPETRGAIAEAYRRGEGSLRQLAARYGTTPSMVQRCVATY